MNEHDGCWRQLVAQMDRCQIKSAKRSDDENHQGGQRRFRDAGRDRSVDKDDETDGAQCRMQQRQRPGRQLSALQERSECDAAERADGKNHESIAKHCNSPCNEGLRLLDAPAASRFPGPGGFLPTTRRVLAVGRDDLTISPARKIKFRKTFQCDRHAQGERKKSIPSSEISDTSRAWPPRDASGCCRCDTTGTSCPFAIGTSHITCQRGERR